MGAEHEMPDMPAAEFGEVRLKETYTWSQTQLDPTQGITEETVAVLDALQKMQASMHAHTETIGAQQDRMLSYCACTAGLGRAEVSRVFYQLLGKCLTRFSYQTCQQEPHLHAFQVFKHVIASFLTACYQHS
jgi:hypothetical protein